MVSRFPPFPNGPSDNATDILNHIGPGYIDMENEVWNHVSNEAKELVKRMLHMDPNRRPTAGQILKYPWITNRQRLPQKFLPEATKDPRTLKVIHLIIDSLKLETQLLLGNVDRCRWLSLLHFLQCRQVQDRLILDL